MNDEANETKDVWHWIAVSGAITWCNIKLHQPNMQAEPNV